MESEEWNLSGVVCSSPSPGNSSLNSTSSKTDMSLDYTYDSSEFDTSLEDSEEEGVSYDNRHLYARACRQFDVIPSHAFVRQVDDKIADVSYSMLETLDIKALCVALTKNYTIQTLDLSRNDLGFKGADYLTQCLQENSYITSLYLASTKLGTDGIAILMKFLKTNNTIEVLDISDNNLTGRHAEVVGEALEVNARLRHLSLSYCGIDEHGCVSISKALAQNMRLKVLDLSWNHLRTRGAVHICQAIGENDCLEVLDLSWNGLGLDGCEALMTSLKANQTLRDLDLSCNRIDLKCLKLLMDGAASNESLQTLKLGKNPVTTEGAIAVLRAIHATPSCRITSLDITGVPVDCEFSKVLEEVQASRDISVRHSENFHKYQVGNIEKLPTLQDYDPVVVLFEYMRQENFRLIDFFRCLDTDNSNTISREELKHVFVTLSIPLTEGGLDDLMERLDTDDNQEIDIDELRKSQKKNMRQMQTMGKWSLAAKQGQSKEKFSHKLQQLVREAVGGRQRKGKVMWRKTAEKIKT
ncbi:leucine-rich repeat-containing protein 74A-like [Haliotis rufescens]|uniref:leucine-rich repeat-containing protein 74A-like n=1 Tax=Haliotis rufescens TaxID=6454 RepID=UPI00201F5573|nr:leucine-rich repeat-containing protein 74A-like [Haliotis rufescens]